MQREVCVKKSGEKAAVLRQKRKRKQLESVTYHQLLCIIHTDTERDGTAQVKIISVAYNAIMYIVQCRNMYKELYSFYLKKLQLQV